MRTNVHGQTIESNLGFSILWTTRPRPEPPEGFKNDVVHFLNLFQDTHKVNCESSLKSSQDSISFGSVSTTCHCKPMFCL